MVPQWPLWISWGSLLAEDWSAELRDHSKPLSKTILR